MQLHDVRLSKYLSRLLRHQPQDAGLTLEEGGWVDVNTLITNAKAYDNVSFTRQALEDVVNNNDKQRFAFNAAGDKIRANQGHSVEIDLQLEPAVPPDALYHGTATRSLEPILREGILKRARHHVHLSRDVETATVVGRRHGSPVVLRVDAAAMHRAGHVFYCSDNGVWLTDTVNPEFITPL
ncbi:MAG: phosphotransferase KptA/Tpt1 [Chthonomonadaceae bacterium]|nr:phosphotransferase KptA/Tpt1 [Chthonomonadaceae bacterium]